MKALALAALVALVALAALAPPARTAEERPVGAPRVTLVVDDAEQPTEIAFLPDGTMLWTELGTGDVRALAPGATGEGEVVANVPTRAGGNGGLLGLAVDPSYETTGALYVYYSAEDGSGKVNRVSRIAGGEETVLVDGIPWAEMHDGGKLAFLPDGTLLVTTGDNEKRAPAQDKDSLLGKVLRINPDGSIPQDNPFGASPVYALGVRNPFGLAVDPATGRVWFSENGPTQWDEVNALRAGGNYGWPACSGPCTDARYVSPIYAWERAFGPTGLAYFRGDLYLGDFVYGRLRAIRLDGAEAREEVVHTFDGGKMLAVAPGPDGASLYVGTLTQIWRVEWPDLLPPAPPTDPTPPTAPTAPTPPTEPTPPSVEAPTTTPEPPQDSGGVAIPAPAALAAAAIALAGALARRRA